MSDTTSSSVATGTGSLKGCLIDGCRKAHVARGWCATHYQRWKKYGDPETVREIQGDNWTRFWSKVSGAGAFDCWLWQDAVDKDGYGVFRWGAGNKRAHRVSWELMRGEIPFDPATGKSLPLDHLCRVPGCVNPEHLEPVTVLVNTRRGLRTSDHACTRGHKRTPENTGVYPKSGFRYCKDCGKEKRMRRKVKKSP